MINKLFTLIGLLLISCQLNAASFKVYEGAIPLTKQAAVLEAADKFMKSETGKTFKGGFHINTILANGISPATHSFALLMPSLEDIHKWESSLVGNSDIQEFWEVLDQHSTPVSEFMGSLIKTWGNVSNEDQFWLLTKFRTTDPAKVVAAQDKLDKAMSDKFPGQVILHAISIGNRTGRNNDYSTHMFIVGYKSVKEMESWTNYMNMQPAWAEYLNSLRDVVTWQGSELIQNTVIYDNGMDVESFHGQ
jgi:hypothetical protein